MNTLGSELAGEVEAVGRLVKNFRPGDRVMAYLGIQMGANAQYVVIPESGMITQMPTNLSFEEACTLPYGALMASAILGRVKLGAGTRILINGASGGIGSMAVQLARHAGAEVTGVCGTRRVEYVRALGAQQVIDYTREDFTKNGRTYDVILDVLGRRSFAECQQSLADGGVLLLASFKLPAVLRMIWTALFGRRKVVCAMASERLEPLVRVRDLVEKGAVRVVMDRSLPWEQAADAHRYLEAGDRTGSVVLTVG